jgi:hypothetical protein
MCPDLLQLAETVFSSSIVLALIWQDGNSLGQLSERAMIQSPRNGHAGVVREHYHAAHVILYLPG